MRRINTAAVAAGSVLSLLLLTSATAASAHTDDEDPVTYEQALAQLRQAQGLLDDVEQYLEENPPSTAPAPSPSPSPSPSPTPGPSPSPTPGPSPTPPPSGSRPYFQAADWLWQPIRSAPVLDPQSAAIVSHLRTGQHVANLSEYATTLRGPGGITASTPRYDVEFDYTGRWGPDPFGNSRVPIPNNTPIPPGGDKHLAIADPATNTVYNMWVARQSGNGWRAGWGAKTPLDGDGRETNGGSSTGSGLARYAAVIRESEIAAGVIPHALFFSTNMAARTVFRYPAVKTDGSNMSGVSNPIPEGARIQLDPSINVDAIPGMSKGERAVAKALQTYGAYVGDNGGARAAFIFEYAPGSSTYRDAGLTGDYFGLERIPWGSVRVLNKWDGS